MRTIELSACALLLAAGGGWAIWLTAGTRPDDIAAAGLGLAVAAPLTAYMAADRKSSGLWLRFGLYGAGLTVSGASLWTGVVRPLQGVPSVGAAFQWLQSLEGFGLVMLVVPPVAVMVTAVLWCEAAIHGIKRLGGGDRRRRAASDLHGRAAFLDRPSMRRLARRRGSCSASGAGEGMPR